MAPSFDLQEDEEDEASNEDDEDEDDDDGVDVAARLSLDKVACVAGAALCNRRKQRLLGVQEAMDSDEAQY